MTTHVASGPVARGRAPRRKADPPALRRLSRTVLIIGTAVSVIAAFGPGWAVRTGIVVAVIAAVVATAAAWRELWEARRVHANEMLAATRAHGRALTEERRQHGAVLDAMTGRARAAAAEIGQHQITIAELHCEISTLHGDKAFLEGEVRHRETTIASLRRTVRAREAELIALRQTDQTDGSGADGQVHALPRRVLAEHESEWDHIPGADELWTAGTHPTIVDLKLLDGTLDAPSYDVVLPNYEGERKFA